MENKEQENQHKLSLKEKFKWAAIGAGVFLPIAVAFPATLALTMNGQILAGLTAFFTGSIISVLLGYTAGEKLDTADNPQPKTRSTMKGLLLSAFITTAASLGALSHVYPKPEPYNPFARPDTTTISVPEPTHDTILPRP